MVFIAFAVIIGLAQRYKGAEIYRHAATGIELPRTIGSYYRGEISPYDEKSADPAESIEYRSPHTNVTIYIRRMSPGSKDTAADVVAQSLAVIKLLNQFSDIQASKVTSPDGKPEWKEVMFYGRANGHQVLSYIDCRIKQGYAIKVRATTDEAMNFSLRAFLQAIQDRVDSAAPLAEPTSSPPHSSASDLPKP